jgi:hypothetical protein
MQVSIIAIIIIIAHTIISYDTDNHGSGIKI